MPGIASPLAGRATGDIDMIIVRENSEGEYSSVGGRFAEGTDDEIVFQESIFTRRGVDRILTYAYEFARRAGRSTTSRRRRSPTASRSRCRSGTSASKRCRPPLSGRAHRPVPRRHPRRELRAAPGLVRCRRRLELIRRHPLGSRTGRRRHDRHRAVGEPQPRARLSVDVRARPRIGARHRRQGHRQPDRPDLVGRDDARSPRLPEAAAAIAAAIEPFSPAARARATSAARRKPPR